MQIAYNYGSGILTSFRFCAQTVCNNK